MLHADNDGPVPRTAAAVAASLSTTPTSSSRSASPTTGAGDSSSAIPSRDSGELSGAATPNGCQPRRGSLQLLSLHASALLLGDSDAAEEGSSGDGGGGAVGGGGGGGGGWLAAYAAPVPQELVGLPELAGVVMTLGFRPLWKLFGTHTTEMIVTRSGRCLFPVPAVRIQGLDPRGLFRVDLEFVPVSQARWRWTNPEWVEDGRVPSLPSQLLSHEQSPASGEVWMQDEVVFARAKITNNEGNAQYHAVLNAFQRYACRFHVTQLDPATRHGVATISRAFRETEFIAVTGYRNAMMRELKKTTNPHSFALSTEQKELLRSASTPSAPAKVRVVQSPTPGGLAKPKRGLRRASERGERPMRSPSMAAAALLDPDRRAWGQEPLQSPGYYMGVLRPSFSTPALDGLVAMAYFCDEQRRPSDDASSAAPRSDLDGRPLALPLTGSAAAVASEEPLPTFSRVPSQACGLAWAAQLPPDAGTAVWLADPELWSRFQEHTTEMILTRQGRCLFPQLAVHVSGLHPAAQYWIAVEFQPVNSVRWRWSSQMWVQNGFFFTPDSERRVCVHEDSPKRGADWMRRLVTFASTKVSNNPDSSHAVLTSFKRYRCRIHVIRFDEATARPVAATSRTFGETEFIAVTVYQNAMIKYLKKSENPHASM